MNRIFGLILPLLLGLSAAAVGADRLVAVIVEVI